MRRSATVILSVLSAAVIAAFTLWHCPDCKSQLTTVVVDMTKATDRTLPNVASTMAVWNGVMNPDRKHIPFGPSAGASHDHSITGFVEWVELVACTGGSASRDLLAAPDDMTVLDDYDFRPLLDTCREVLTLGMKPYLKLGGVPKKYSQDVDGGDRLINIRPPANDVPHYRYMRALAAALRKEFGLEEARSWRFAVLTEADDIRRFSTRSGDPRETRDEFFRLYDCTAYAFEQELGTNLVFGTHLLDVQDGHSVRSFDIRDFCRHCSMGHNYATSGVGAPLRLLTMSHYEIPGIGNSNAACVNSIGDLAEAARDYGYDDLVIGIDEGCFLGGAAGRDGKGLVAHVVGESYQAGADVRFARSVVDAGADYFASWGYFTGPDGRFEGVPSHHYFASRELARFSGFRQIVPEVVSSPDGDFEIDAIAGVSADGRNVRAAIGRLRDQLDFGAEKSVAVTIRLPPEWCGADVEMRVLTLDDRNNWFTDWQKDRRLLSVESSDFSGCPDEVVVMSEQGLVNAEHRRVFVGRLQPSYAAKAASVKPMMSTSRVSADGQLFLQVDFMGNGASFIEVIRR